MSHYLQRLVKRADAGGGPLSGLEPTGPLESSSTREADPFETAGESVAGIAPLSRGDTVVREKHLRHEAVPQLVAESPRMPSPPSALDVPAGIMPIPPRVESQPSRIERHREPSESGIAPQKLVPTIPPAIPSVSRMERRPAPGTALRQATTNELRLEPARVDAVPPAHLFASNPARREETEAGHAPEVPSESVETDLPEFAAARSQPKRSEPIRLDAPPLQMRETTLEPAPAPLLEIGHLHVEVVPGQPSVREVVRVVSGAPAARRYAGVSSKLRFGLGQM
jgi:hypothetical protein